jgi:menaquinone-dependent protoporphyrinogen oxidase
MHVLVAYATKHGATRQVAERIADTMRTAGLNVEAQPIKEVADVTVYDAFVVGGAVYFGSWLKEVTTFIQRNEATLSSRPVWLFSSGPLGTAATDANGCDLREATLPKELAGVTDAIMPRDHRVFFGALDHTTFDIPERLLWALPPSRGILIEGDFRDWAEIEAWAESIARELTQVSTPG